MNEQAQETTGTNHVCPVNHAGWLASSLRKLVHNPDAILRGLVREGDTAVDLGCGPGFFTLPLARLVGREGHVIAVDLQEEMLRMLHGRAERAGLSSRIQRHLCTAGSLGLTAKADFALAFYMAHETPDAAAFLREVHGLLSPGGRLLLAEPRFHVGREAFRRTLALAGTTGFRITAEPRIRFSRAALLARD